MARVIKKRNEYTVLERIQLDSWQLSGRWLEVRDYIDTKSGLLDNVSIDFEVEDDCYGGSGTLICHVIGTRPATDREIEEHKEQQKKARASRARLKERKAAEKQQQDLQRAAEALDIVREQYPHLLVENARTTLRDK